MVDISVTATVYGLATGFWCGPSVISARSCPRTTLLRLTNIWMTSDSQQIENCTEPRSRRRGQVDSLVIGASCRDWLNERVWSAVDLI